MNKDRAFQVVALMFLAQIWFLMENNMALTA